MNREIIKNWLKENLDDSSLLETQKMNYETNIIYPDGNDDLIKNLKENYNLRDIPLKEVISGKKFLRGLRKNLQREILDWTLSPYLEKQTFVNREIISKLEAQTKIINESESMKSSLESFEQKFKELVDSKMKKESESMKSSLESFEQKFKELVDSKILEQKRKSSELLLSIKNLYLDFFERPMDTDALNYYYSEIQKNKLTIDQLKTNIKNSEEYKTLTKNKKILKEFQSKIKKPIFIIGVPRTGTTLLQNILSSNEKLAWFSDRDISDWMPLKEQFENHSYFQWLKSNKKKIPRSEYQIFALGVDPKLNSDFKGINRNGKTIFPIEGEIFWKKYFGTNYIKDIPVNTKILLCKEIVKLIERQDKERFISKAPQNFMRVFALQKCFPDAKFINVSRDPREVISSMIIRNEKEGTWDPGIPIKNKMKYDGLEIVEQFAWLYYEITNYIYEFFMKNQNNCMTVKYEELITNPNEIVKRIFTFADLDIPNNISKSIPQLQDTSKKWKDKISPDDEKKIFNILDETIKKMDYPYSL